MTRYDLRPLLDALGNPSLTEAAGLVGVSVTSLRHYRDDGMPAATADRLAIAAHLHPALVWASWVDDGLGVLDRMFVEDGGWRTGWLWREQAA